MEGQDTEPFFDLSINGFERKFNGVQVDANKFRLNDLIVSVRTQSAGRQKPEVELQITQETADGSSVVVRLFGNSIQVKRLNDMRVEIKTSRSMGEERETITLVPGWKIGERSHYSRDPEC